MAFDLLSWAIGYALKKGLDRLLTHKSLASNLQKAFSQWAKNLPPEAHIYPDSDFAVIDQNPDPAKQPSLCALRNTLLDNHIPTESQWLDAFLERWLWVRGNIEYTQPFFQLPQTKANQHLSNLAKSLAEECKKYDTLFKVSTIDELLKISSKLDSLLPHTKPMIHNLPYTSMGDLFKGRDDILGLLKDHLDDNKTTAIIQTIHGLGGIGKTRLAVEFAWWAIAKKKYKAVFFIKSETPQLLHTSLASLAAKDMLGLTEHGVDQQTAELAVFQWLAANKGWLMILDSIDTEESAKVVEDLLPHLATGHVIITSRYKHWSAAVTSNTLGLLDKNKAKEFLLQRTAGRRLETQDDEEIAGQLAKEVGFLPLALEQIGAYIAHNKCSLSEYLHQWQNEKDQVLKWFDKRQMQYPVSVAVTWQRTFDRLGASVRAVLRICAFLAPEFIPAKMFEEGIDILKDAAVLQSKEMGCEECKFNLKGALSELSAYSLITRYEKGFTIHRMVQEVIGRQIPKKTDVSGFKRRFCLWIVSPRLNQTMFALGRYGISFGHTLSLLPKPRTRKKSPTRPLGL